AASARLQLFSVGVCKCLQHVFIIGNKQESGTPLVHSGTTDTVEAAGHDPQ
ncbi:Hypothetical predicted protein, partial [Marmota monax]